MRSDALPSPFYAIRWMTYCEGAVLSLTRSNTHSDVSSISNRWLSSAGQRSPAVAKRMCLLGPCILALLGLLIRSKIQKNITNLPEVPRDINNYRFSNFNNVITAEDDALVQHTNRTNFKMATRSIWLDYLQN